LVELGLQHHLWPESAGGGGGASAPASAPALLALAVEQAARGDVGLGLLAASYVATAATATLCPEVAPSARGAAAARLCRADEPVICAPILPRLAAVDDEADAAALFDGRLLQARCRREGEGWGVNAPDARPLVAGHAATFYLVLCAAAAGQEPLLLLVPASAGGISRGEPTVQAGLASLANGRVSFSDVRLPADACLGAGRGVHRFFRSWLHLLIAASCSGGLLTGLSLLRQWADARVIKGRGQRFRDNPLTADLMARLVERSILCRHLLLDLARALGRPDLYGDATTIDVELLGAAIARQVVDCAGRGLDQTLELMGSAGYATEWNLERFWRDVQAARCLLDAGPVARMAVARRYCGSEVE
jgi:alkylation response protein AidB-like acyl-CoA dehydrogenase